MNLMLVLGALSLSVCLPLLWWAFAGASSDGGARENLSAAMPAPTARSLVLSQPASTRVTEPAVERIANRARRVTPVGIVDKLQHRLALAGHPSGMTLESLLAIKLVVALVLGALGVMLFFSNPSAMTIALAVALGIGGFMAPDMWIDSKAKARQHEIQLTLADTIDQLAVSVEAGVGFEAAITRVARARTGPLADELARTVQDLLSGSTRAQALHALVDRTDVVELRHFVHAVVQAEQYGVPIAQVLRTQSKELRLRRRQAAEERAMKMPVKVVFPLVLCILPALFIVILGPAAIRIYENILKG